ncbi:MAG: alpha-ketoglutarate-dependent dioxygenase AlkB family protein [Actinomycetota bacterium]
MSGSPRLPLESDPHELLPRDGSALLVPDFLTPDDADALLDRLGSAIPWEATSLVMFGREVAEPRLSAWIADKGVVYGYSGRTRRVHPWTPDLDRVRGLCELRTGAPFNGVLANLYRNGRDHMGWHADDEPSLGPEPIIASVSLGAERRFDLRHRKTGETISCLLPHGSLLVMSGRSQTAWKHRLPRSARVSDPRLNLTFRLVRSP